MSTTPENLRRHAKSASMTHGLVMLDAATEIESLRDAAKQLLDELDILSEAIANAGAQGAELPETIYVNQSAVEEVRKAMKVITEAWRLDNARR